MPDAAALPVAAAPPPAEPPPAAPQPVAPLSIPHAAAAGGTLSGRGRNLPLASGAAAANDRYDQLTPRTGAKAAQVASISALMSAADATWNVDVEGP